MEALVVGGTGLIGHYAARALIARGHGVRVMARHAPAAGALPHGAAFVSGDLEKGDLDAALDGVTGLVHAAGTDYRVTPHGSAWEFFRRRNVEASARLFSRAAEKGVTRGVLVSSFYHAIRPDLASHPYIRSRVESEIRALQSAGAKLALSIIQPPYIVGHVPGRDSLASVLTRYVRSSAPLLAPTGGGNFMSATSLAEAISTALEDGPPGGRFLVGDENLCYAEIVLRFARAAGRERHCFQIPAGVLSAFGAASMVFAHLGGRQPGMDWREFAETLSGDLFYDSEPSRRELHYPVGLVDRAINEAVAAIPRS
jgi:nucleoside-diphosphate-sugar epimerase